MFQYGSDSKFYGNAICQYSLRRERLLQKKIWVYESASVHEIDTYVGRDSVGDGFVPTFHFGSKPPQPMPTDSEVQFLHHILYDIIQMAESRVKKVSLDIRVLIVGIMDLFPNDE